jgi:hypothetical protein
MKTIVISDELAEKLNDYKEMKLQHHRFLNATELAEDIECSLPLPRFTLMRIAGMLRLFDEVVKSIQEP